MAFALDNFEIDHEISFDFETFFKWVQLLTPLE